MHVPVVGKCGTRDPKQPGAHAERVTLEIETTHSFENDLRGQILGLLVIAHLARDVVVDQAKVFLVKCLKILCIHYFYSLHLLIQEYRSMRRESHCALDGMSLQLASLLGAGTRSLSKMLVALAQRNHLAIFTRLRERTSAKNLLP